MPAPDLDSLRMVATIGDVVDGAARETGAEALVFPDSRLTYPELSEAGDRFARSLHGLGVGRGDKVGIFMPAREAFVLALIAAAKLGAIAVPVNGRYRAHELATVIAHADIKVLLTGAGPTGAPDYPALLEQVFTPGEHDPEALALPSVPALRCIVSFGPRRAGFVTAERFAAVAESVTIDEVRSAQRRVRVDDIALLMYTSGTTSRPKGCLLTHEALVGNGSSLARTRLGVKAGDRLFDPLPLFHNGGLVPMLGCFAERATYCHPGHFEPTPALEMLERERITVAYPAFETIWAGVLQHPRFAGADLSALRVVMNIAVPEKLVRMQAAMPGACELSAYGSTECTSVLSITSVDDPYEVRMQTLGHPMPGTEVRIVDPGSGSELAPGEVGELCGRGYSVFNAYYKEPELTAAAFSDGGWFHSGDLGTLDDEGRVRYAGRLKDMLKVGGENVSALEVEGFLARHEAVSIVQVVGAPDARYDEVPAAFIELRPGAEATEAEMIKFCKGAIATYKVPRYVRFVSEWPMSGTKIQKFALRERLAAELAAAGVSEAPRMVV